jgi:hypothetical protein
MNKLTSLSFPTRLFFISLIFVGCKKDNPVPVNHPPLVNAGTSQTISWPVDSVRLSGAVTDGDSKVVACLWSEISGPNVPVIASEGSLTTQISSLIPGSYIFQLMAVDSVGLTGVDTVSVLVNPPTTISLAPANNPFEFEYTGTATNTDESPGSSSPELGAEAWTIGGALALVRSSFQFDMSTLPVNIPIASAKLSLYSTPTPLTGNLSTPNAGTANAMYIRRISNSWDPATTLWPTQPGTDTTGQILIPQSNLAAQDLINIDVTGLVRKMLSSGNHGFMIRLQTEAIYNSRIFCSSKYSDASKHPRLVINY